MGGCKGGELIWRDREMSGIGIEIQDARCEIHKKAIQTFFKVVSLNEGEQRWNTAVHAMEPSYNRQRNVALPSRARPKPSRRQGPVARHEA